MEYILRLLCMYTMASYAICCIESLRSDAVRTWATSLAGLSSEIGSLCHSWLIHKGSSMPGMAESEENSCDLRLPNAASQYPDAAANAQSIPCVCYLPEHPVYTRYNSAELVSPSLCYDSYIASCNCYVLFQKWVDFSTKEVINLKHIRMGGKMNLQELL